MKHETLELTKKIGKFIVETEAGDIPSVIYEHAKVAFLDWLGVTIAGKDEPLVGKLIKYSNLMGGNHQATILGHGIKKNLSQAALINGAASHALDYDDTHMLFIGHPSVTMFPSLIALAEWKKSSGKEFLTSYLIGFKVGAAIGTCAGMDHYMSGWHATSTIGTFASAAVCSKILGLTEQQTIHALGIAGTQACGLKRSFGTMCKPFHAGRASQSGLIAVLLALEGFTSANDILEGPFGFLEVLNGKVRESSVNSFGKTWDIENLAQKYHASCHATHSPIEAVTSIVQEKQLRPDDIRSITIHTSRMAVDAAGHTEPKTGLEGKFSINYCVANAVLRGNTGMHAFTDAKVNNPEIKAFMNKISIIIDKDMKDVKVLAEIKTNNGDIYSKVADIIGDIPDLNIKREKISSKFDDLCSKSIERNRIKEIVELILNLEKIDDMNMLIDIL